MLGNLFKRLLARKTHVKANTRRRVPHANHVGSYECFSEKTIIASSLCSDILILIFKEAIGQSTVDLSSWKQSLPLIAVCQSWRASALHIVYSRVFLNLNVQSSNKRTSFISIGGQKLPKYKHYSNSSLLIDDMLSCMAKSLHISIHHPISALSLYRGIVDLLNFQMASWHNIKHLSFEFGPNVLNNITENYADPQVFIRKFTNCIPQLDNLEIAVLDLDKHKQCEFVNKFTDAYAGRLKQFSIDTDITLYSSQFSNCLTKLEISMTPLSIQSLPCINPSTLQQLSLFDVAANFAWSIFAKNCNSVLEFTSLQKLSIGYIIDKANNDMANVNEENTFMLNFPALKNLHIFRCPPDCSLLSKSMYPAKLDKVVVVCPPGLKTLTKLKSIVPSKELTVMLSELKEEDKTRYHNTTNEMFKSTRIADKPALIILNRQSVPNPDIIQWDSLSYLSIRTVVFTSTLLKLLAKLPNLDRLTANCLISNHLASDACFPKAQSQGGPAKCAIHPKLTDLHLNFALDSKITSRDTEFVLYLMAGINVLVNIKVGPLLLSKLNRLVKHYSTNYPHIQNVKLASCK